MAALYKITGQYLYLMQMMEEGEADPQVIRDTMESIEGELEDKADNYAKMIREFSAEAEKFKAEKERLAKMQERAERNAEALKRSLFEAMKLTGKLKFKTSLFSFAIQKNGGKRPIEIKAGAEIPEAFREDRPDMKKVRKALEAGIPLPFAGFKERGEGLRIR